MSDPQHPNLNSLGHWVTRFAPSPTGYLHLGHVASLIYVRTIAKKLDADVILRMEDHDRGRCRPEFERATFDDLTWLGCTFTNNDFVYGVSSSYRQSDNLQAYDSAIKALNESGLVYGCKCSRQDIIKRTGDLTGDELRYDGHCRNLGVPIDQAGVGIRLRMQDQSETFVDAHLGLQSQHPITQCGDLLLRERHNNYTYNFAVVVDDLRHGVNLVIRGNDVLHATARQIYLARLLGQSKPPVYFHHGLIVDASGVKLSKRTFADAIAKRRAAGESAAKILGEAAHAIGFIEQPRATSWDELDRLQGKVDIPIR